MDFDQKAYEKQLEADRAETARLKALWDKENAVDKGARREAAAKAAAEQEARETPSPEDLARGKEIFAAVHHHWVQRGSEPRHRLLLDGDNKTVLAHIFSMSLTHPFRKSAWGHEIKLPADKFANDKRWCILTVSLDLQWRWKELLEREDRDAYQYAERIKADLWRHEQHMKAPPTPEPTPEPVDLSEYDAFKKLHVGDVLDDGGIRAVVEAVLDDGTLRLKIEAAGLPFLKHIHIDKTYTFKLHSNWDGDFNMWSLRGEEHECAQRRSDGHVSYGADLLLVFDDEKFSFDLDS